MYALSELFAKEMSEHLRIAFASQMQKFDENLENEGLSGKQGRFASTPFTCFSVTRDYKCDPHDDPTDYGYGIVVWLHPGLNHQILFFEYVMISVIRVSSVSIIKVYLSYQFANAGGELEVDEYPTFWLPQYKVRFGPPNGSAVLLNGNSTVHCTTRPKEVGILGIAFVQKRNQIVAVKKAIDNPTEDVGKLFLQAKGKYETRRVSIRSPVCLFHLACCMTMIV